MTTHAPFSVVGLEIEYVIVDRQRHDARPIADAILRDATGAIVNDIDLPGMAASNELTAHVVELKHPEPHADLVAIGERFHHAAMLVNERLAPHAARLLPMATHPWFDPARDTVLWPHDGHDIYRAFDRLFDCRRHGWANCQSIHVNLPFNDDASFAALHRAIRVALPVLPAIAAASPIQGGRPTGWLDHRLFHYRHHADRFPAIVGAVIPEPVGSPAEYQDRILRPLYAAVAPVDPDGILAHEWLNARGAIARFQRDAIEIRVLDSQECPRRDVTIAWLTTGLVRLLAEESLSSAAAQAEPTTEAMAALFDAAARRGPDALLTDRATASALGHHGDLPVPLGDWWRACLDRLTRQPWVDQRLAPDAEAIMTTGPLARRMLGLTGHDPTPGDLQRLTRRLIACLEHDEPLAP